MQSVICFDSTIAGYKTGVEFGKTNFQVLEHVYFFCGVKGNLLNFSVLNPFPLTCDPIKAFEKNEAEGQTSTDDTASSVYMTNFRHDSSVIKAEVLFS